jgi:hypothetical protein
VVSCRPLDTPGTGYWLLSVARHVAVKINSRPTCYRRGAREQQQLSGRRDHEVCFLADSESYSCDAEMYNSHCNPDLELSYSFVSLSFTNFV